MGQRHDHRPQRRLLPALNRPARGWTRSPGEPPGFSPANGWVDISARWYDPVAGQFTSRDSASIDPVPNPAAANPFAYVADNPLDGTDPTGHMLNYAAGSLDGTAPPSSGGGSQLPAPSCSGWTCLVQDAVHSITGAYHVAVNFYHVAVRVAVSGVGDVGAAVDATMRFLHESISAAVREAGHLAHDLAAGIADAARRGIHVLGQAWHVVQSATSGVAHAVTHWAVQQYRAAVNVVHTAVHDVARAVSVTADFVKAHAAAIASVVVSAVVFVGCDAALGIPTGGVGAVAGAAVCGALAGAVGNSVSYGITAAQTGKFSWSGLAASAASGGGGGGAGWWAGRGRGQ
jgi:large repetitive protein